MPSDVRNFGTGRGVRIIGGASANWVATGDEWKREFERYIAAMPIAVAAGPASFVPRTRTQPCTTISAKTPIERQVEIMTSNFRQAARVAEDRGILIAFENHLDYRASEIARVIEAVNSPALPANNFDTGNPVGVIEDPVDAAKAVACYTVMAHLKDFRIQPLTVDGEPRILWAPIGRGNIELEQILTVLEAEADDPS